MDPDLDLDLDIAEITPEELVLWQKTGRRLVIFDTLPGEHFQERHVPGAKNACVYEVAFPTLVEAAVDDPDTDIVVYSSSWASQGAVVAAEKLLRSGYKNVSILTGGLAAWREAGLPLEGADPQGQSPPHPVIAPQARVYKADPEAGSITWTGRNANGRHTGTLLLSGGEIKVAQEGLSGFFTIDMTSIKNLDLKDETLNRILVRHLESDDFFFVQKYPTAEFVISKARPIAESTPGRANFEFAGKLTLRGHTHPISFPATVMPLADGGLVAEAHFDFDRTNWGVNYGSGGMFEHLGMHLVYDAVSVQVRVVVR